MKSFTLPFAVAVINQTTFAATLDSTLPAEYLADTEQNELTQTSLSYIDLRYHWYDEPDMTCVAYSYDPYHVEYVDAEECCFKGS